MAGTPGTPGTWHTWHAWGWLAWQVAPAHSTHSPCAFHPPGPPQKCPWSLGAQNCPNHYKRMKAKMIFGATFFFEFPGWLAWQGGSPGRRSQAFGPGRGGLAGRGAGGLAGRGLWQWGGLAEGSLAEGEAGLAHLAHLAHLAPGRIPPRIPPTNQSPPQTAVEKFSCRYTRLRPWPKATGDFE